MTATIIPTDSAELEEMLSDKAKMAGLFDDAGTPKAEFGEFITNYARSVHAKDENIAAQIKDETARVFAEMLKENGIEKLDMADPKPTIGPSDPIARQHKLNNPKADGAKLDGMFDNVAEFFQTAWHQNASNPDLTEKRGELRNAFGSDTPGAGGFLIPEEFRSELLRVALETSVVRPLARTIPMGSSRVAIPMIDSTSNATTTHGGIATAWSEEAATLIATQAKFGRVVLDAKKLTAYAEVPNELLMDSAISFQALVEDIYPEAIAFGEDVAFCTGSGAGEPKGFTNADAEVAVAKEAAQTADTILWANIVKMYSRMLPGSLGRAVWVANIDTFPALAQMQSTDGTVGGPVWITNGTTAPVMTLLGRPIIFTEKVGTVGDVNDINFVDFGYYLIGDRQSMSVASSEHVNFPSDVTAYRIIERVDGRPWIQSAISPQTGANTLSPFVTLAERA